MIYDNFSSHNDIPIEMEKGYEFKEYNGYVKGDVYYNGAGEAIKIGDYIRLHFAGFPINMPQPWTLIKAENYFSTVGYDNRVRLEVKADNGNEMSFDDVHYYSPELITDQEAETMRKRIKERGY